jgi:hypothetical protein
LFAQSTEFEDVEYYNEQYLKYENTTYKEAIKSVQLYREGWELTYPVISINNRDETLKLCFDDISKDIKNYYFKIIHCNSSWKPSSLNYSDYIDGFEENQIDDYRFSINTLINYVHYSLTFPNERLKILISGNYIIQVYEDGNPENLVLTRRFYCVDTKMNIDASCKKSTNIYERDTHQKIDFKIKHNSLKINDPYKDLKVFISQNGRSDGLISGLQPQFIRENELIYEYDEGNLFDGNNEFRNFDIKSIRYQTEYINNVKFIKPLYHVELKDDFTKHHKQYFFEKDINGKYLVKITEGEDSSVEADYVMVHFRLAYDIPIVTGNLYLYGEITDWQMNKKNQLKYNFSNQAYEISMLLKQGYYNYTYAYLEDGANYADQTLIEGNHYETENEYLIFVYYKDISDRYEQLVAFQVVNSRK